MENSLVSSGEISDFLYRIRHSDLLRKYSGPVRESSERKSASTESFNISEIRGNSYSLQRSDILEEYHKEDTHERHRKTLPNAYTRRAVSEGRKVRKIPSRTNNVR